MGMALAYPRIARVSRIKLNFFVPEFWPNLGPGRRLLDSDRRDAEFASVSASVAFLTVSLMPKSIFWNSAQQKVKKYVQAGPGKIIIYGHGVGISLCGPEVLNFVRARNSLKLQ